MTGTVLGKRYATALFAVAKEDGKLEEFGASLRALGGLLEANPEVEMALVSPVYPADIKQKIVDELIKALSIEGILVNFLGLLVDRRRIQYLASIISSYEELMDEEMGVVRAVVKTAVSMTPELEASIAKIMADISGKKVVLRSEVDPAIIGGVVARIGDTVWDGSIRSQLRGFKNL